MSVLLPVNNENTFCYNIMLEPSFEKFYSKMDEFQIHNKKLCIVTETNVGPLYAEELKNGLASHCQEVVVFTFPAGEASKNLDVIYDLYQFLIEHHFDRKDMLIALGGGVTGDMTGFAAATYMRGIEFVQVPTSLLAQVDSSIGGKTGVDFKGYKNMVGAFKQPKLVYMNLNTLKTLKHREFVSGMSEIIKHGFIKNSAYLDWLESHSTEIFSMDYDTLEYMIAESCKVKRAVVEYDPKETLGERAKLNFGHTIGHAIEKLMDFQMLHGECVAIGIVAALFLSFDKHYISEEKLKRGIKLLQTFELPIAFTELDIEEVLLTTLSDKKMDSGVIQFVLLEQIGSAIIDRTINFDTMRPVLETIKQ